MFPPAPDKEDGKAGSTGLFAATDNIREGWCFLFILVKLFSTVSSHLVYGLRQTDKVTFTSWLKVVRSVNLFALQTHLWP